MIIKLYVGFFLRNTDILSKITIYFQLEEREQKRKEEKDHRQKEERIEEERFRKQQDIERKRLEEEFRKQKEKEVCETLLKKLLLNYIKLIMGTYLLSANSSFVVGIFLYKV